MEQLHTPVAHVVILPFPAQGHVKPMFKLAKILCHHANFHVTFVNSDHNHDRFLSSIDLPALNHRLPNLRLESIPDGLPPEHPRIGHAAVDLFFSTRSITTKQHFKDLLKKESLGGRLVLPPTCVIADGIMSFAIDVAEELDVPIITFRTYSASCTWLYFHFQNLIQQGEIPFPENEDMDRPISCIPGFESILRRRDLPGFLRVGEIENPILEFYISQTTAMTRASALILDTFEELESAFISRLASLFPKIYTIGPLHAHAHVHGSKTETSSSSSDVSLWKQDRNCITWLDSHPSKSVLYVSFGSIITLTRDQLLEFWFGVVNSGQRFLWVMRPDLVAGDDGGVAGVGQIPVELLEVTKQRGCIVSWAPQDEVLAHEAIGGFLTHTGWNSTLESIYTGIPMIGWPQMADQQFNSRCVSEVWKIGFDMKDTCDRFTVEKMVRLLMKDDDTSTREEIMKSTVEISNMARDSVKQGGSSYCSLQNLIHDIQSMCLKK